MDNTEKYGNLVLLTEDGTIDNNVSLDNIVGCLNNMIDYLNAEAEYSQKLVEDKISQIKSAYAEGIPSIKIDPKILEPEDIY
jgi:hypothetical protein